MKQLWLAILLITLPAAGCTRPPESTGPREAAPTDTASRPPAQPPAVRHYPTRDELLQAFKGPLKTEADRKNPSQSSPTALAAAKQDYTNLCASCHGDSGKGNGPAAAAYQPPPADLTALAGPQGGLTDGMLHYIIAYGVGQMPPFQSQLSEERRWQLVNYLRQLAKPK